MFRNAIFSFFLLSTGSVSADALCSTVEIQVPIDGATSCRQVAESGGASSFQCWWQFEFRDDGDDAFFTNGIDELKNCMADATILLDQPVNHPDSYSLYSFVTPTKEVSLSYKDKSALGQSFVFFRVSSE